MSDLTKKQDELNAQRKEIDENPLRSGAWAPGTEKIKHIR